MTTKTASIPSSEGKFAAYARNFVGQLTGHPARYGVNESRVQLLDELLSQYDNDSAKAVAAKDAARAATVQKEESRKALADAMRSTTRVIQANDEVTNAAREDAGIPVHKTSRTPVPVPKSFPVASVIATDRLEHTVSFSDSSTPTRRGKPAGVQGCEVYVAVADTPPTDTKAYRFIAMSTRSPQKVTFEADAGGKTANYMLRWVNTKGEKGPWGTVLSATIPAV